MSASGPFTVESIPGTPTADSVSRQLGHAIEQEGLSVRLRKATGKAHEEVMQPAIVAKLVSGQLPQDIHLRYLMMLYSIYSALENGLDAHSTHPHLCTVYIPALLARAPALESDCSYYTSETDWKANSAVWKALEEENPQSLRAYVARLEALAKDDEGKPATLLLAHSYVRYLGDLSGGQTIARTIRRSYNLPATHEGSAFYEFYLPPTPGSTTGLPTAAGTNEVKEIKTWFRDGLDRAGEAMSEDERTAVLREARHAFELNIDLFKSFEGEMKKWTEASGEEVLSGEKDGGVATVEIAVTPSGGWAVRQTTATLAWFGVALALLLAAYIAIKDAGVITL